MPAPIPVSANVGPGEGILWHPALISCGLSERWVARASTLYLGLDTERSRGDWPRIERLIPPGEKLALTASSFTVGAILSEEDLQIVAGLFKQGMVGQWLRQQLGRSVAWDLDQSWMRRQYAPGRYPRWHAPHAWHQDGALGFDFAPEGTRNGREVAPIEMVTCWIALNACGADSPGLEFVNRELDHLLQPADLTEECVCRCFLAGDFWRPTLAAGDALLFRGGVPHRTHVVPEMTRDRTSIELRFFPSGSVPERFQPDRLIVLNESPER